MIIFSLIYLVSFFVFLNKRSKLLMHFFQQEEYDGKRFLQYVFRKLQFVDKRLSGVILLSILLTYLTRDSRIHLFAISALLLISAFLHINPCKEAKKVLVLTQRVKRILSVFYSIYALIFAGLGYLRYQKSCNLSFYLVTVLLIQMAPFIMVVANLLLSPLEKRVCNKYLQEAKDKMAELRPIVIGITGSYGKTSTRSILEHIMTSAVPTLATPGSVNTTMGITRIIRERLKPEHKYFIVEMGAYRPGSIAERCELAPPTYGIITSVGDAHYERFKTVANVAKTKFELAQAVFKVKEGKMIINGETIDQKYIDKYVEKENKRKVIQVAHSKKLGDYVISEEKQTKDGVEFKLKIEKHSFKIKAPVYGMHQISNIALAFSMAYNIGISPDSILASLKSLPQAPHRLEVKKTPIGAILIDDAYNSNPTGFKSALQTLKLLKQKGGRTILVTPGMVELGKLHDDEHYKIGKVAGEFADVVLTVIPKRIPTFIKGFQEVAGLKQKLIKVDTFGEASKWLETNLTANDVVLYENDLPDLYETKVKI